MSDVTHILSQIESGDPSASEQLLPLVYDELRKLAVAKLAHEKSGKTLQATALVHEVYMRLVGESGGEGQEAANWNSRGSSNQRRRSFQGRQPELDRRSRTTATL